MSRVISMSSLVGKSTSSGTISRKVKTMAFNFSHLKSLSGIKTSSKDQEYVDENDSQTFTLTDKNPDEIKVNIPSQHSREHNVAISDEAKKSPVLAVQLLRTTELSSKKLKLN